MNTQTTATRLLLIGCGKMGSALLEGWLDAGVKATDVWIEEPSPSPRLIELENAGLHLNRPPDWQPDVCLVAVKPQMMGAALAGRANLGDALILSIAAGTTIATFAAIFGSDKRIVRAMPNTPAAIGRGISAIVGNEHATPQDLALAETLLSAVGQVVQLASEDQIDAVTAVSGSGPAYVFHMTECLAAAAEAEGLPTELSWQLARATMAGAGALLDVMPESAEQLRINVTSPGGTTEAGLGALMSDETGLLPLMKRTVAAATARGRALGKA